MNKKINESRHDNDVVLFEEQLEPLQRNLLFIRECYNVIYGKKYGMENFYDSVGCTADDYSNILTKKLLSTKNHKIISENLHSFGVEKSALRMANALEFEWSSDIADCMDIYFAPDSDKSDKEWALKTLKAFILKSYYEENKYMAGILAICYNLASRSGDIIENNLDAAYDVLSALDDVDFSEKNIKSRQFAKFITGLAKTVNTVEEIFPEFYAVAQQMKEDKSAQSIMNEISNNLKLLQSKQITMTDVESDSCLNMVKNLTTIMSEIQGTILTAQKDAQEQARLAIELLNQK